MRILSVILFSIRPGEVSLAKEYSLVRKTLERDLAIRQKPGTENLPREYLRGVPADNGTLHALLYKPTLCPRCEACIKLFYKKAKR